MFDPRPEMMNRRVEILSPASCLQNSNWLFQESNATKWTRKENKLFESALAFFDKETPDRWVQVAAMIPGKSIGDVMRQYYELVEDVNDIEAGLIRIPDEDYTNPFTLELVDNNNKNNRKKDLNGSINFYCHGGKKSCLSTPSSDLVKKKGVPWTEQEHRQFLVGLKKFGKGDWRNIAHNCVKTRTPTQVASHAQKYFIRQQHCHGEGNKDSNTNTNSSKRRSSIHDITTANLISDSKLPPLQDGKNAASALPQNHSWKSANGNMFYMAPICGISLYGPNYNHKMQEQNLIEGTIHGS